MRPKSIIIVPLIGDQPENTLVIGAPINGGIPEWDDALSFDFTAFMSFLSTIAEHGYTLTLSKDKNLILKPQRKLLA